MKNLVFVLSSVLIGFSSFSAFGRDVLESDQKIRDLTEMVKKNVAGFPSDINALEANELVVIQSPEHVYIVGNFFTKGQSVDVIDAKVTADKIELKGIYYNIGNLDGNAVAKSLATIQGNSAFKTFMKKDRFKGLVRIDVELLANDGSVDMKKAEPIYRQAITSE
ncbi:MAG: hypothetical protein AABY64_12370 [Bdellovibrionota bacterium]